MTEPSAIGISGIEAAKGLLTEAQEKIDSARNLISGYAANMKNGPGKTMRAHLAAGELEHLDQRLKDIQEDVKAI